MEWFQSYYNFKVQNLPPHFPSDYWITTAFASSNTNDNGNTRSTTTSTATTRNESNSSTVLLNRCMDYHDVNCVGTGKGLFHVYLAQLGKTLSNATSLTELKQLYPTAVEWDGIRPTSNPIFLYDVQQLSASSSPTTLVSDSRALFNSSDDPQRRRLDQFQHDLQSLLGDLPTHYKTSTSGRRIQNNRTMHQATMSFQPSNGHGHLPPHVRPRMDLSSHGTLQDRRDTAKMNICHSQHLTLRLELLRLAKEVSRWIRFSGFLDHPDVHVSSREYLEQQVLGSYWMRDPCDKESQHYYY